MFVKPFKTKTNVKIRGSDRKHLKSEIEKKFIASSGGTSNGKDEETYHQPIATNKDEISVLKIFTHKKDVATVYMINKNPLFFEIDKTLYPSLYYLWKCPAAVPCLTTSSPVVTKLANGADLMLPGIIVISPENLPSFSNGSIVAINTESNMFPLALGIALKSSRDIYYSSDRQGKAVQILHVFGDHLWEAGERLQPPKRDHPKPMNTEETESETSTRSDARVAEELIANESSSGVQTSDQVQDLSDDVKQLSVSDSSSASKDLNQDEQLPSEIDTLTTNISAEGDATASTLEETENLIEKMDVLLRNCVFTALKVKLKDKELPIPTGTFYRSNVLSCCPTGEFLDIKKTSFKKLGKYLKHLEKEGLIGVKELTKGVDHIISVNRAHPDLKTFEPLPAEETTASDDVNTESQFGVLTQKHYEPPEIKLLYGVNAATSQFFNAVRCSKGTVLDAVQVRQIITNYVRENELVSDKFVTLDPILHNIMFGKGGVDTVQVKWDALFNRMFSLMQEHHQLLFKGARPIVKKGSPPKIMIKLEKRMGNKKVTLVQNLEHFLIRPQEFTDLIRKKAQASTSVTTLPGSKPTQPLQQILIQGNQVRNVESILTGDHFKLPRKYIVGLEQAPKAKGNKRK